MPIDVSLQMDGYGWEEDPPDEKIVRMRTKLGQLRLWMFPRSLLGTVNGKDFAGTLAHPGIYILLDESNKKAYIGESSDLRKRLNEHDKNGPKELPNWESVLVISDGRSHYQSIFTETTFRQYLEKATIRHLQEGNTFEPVNKVREEPYMTAALENLAHNMNNELGFVLGKLDMAHPIDKPKAPSTELKIQEIKELLKSRSMTVEKVSRDQLRIKSEEYYKRPGTKPRETELGWHITLRSKPRENLSKGKGGLIISRGCGYLIPADDLKGWLGERLWPMEPGKETIDVYADLDEEKLYRWKDEPPLDLKPYRLSKTKVTTEVESSQATVTG